MFDTQMQELCPKVQWELYGFKMFIRQSLAINFTFT